MIEHPDFLNVRKLAILMISGPFALLALLAAINPYWQQSSTAQIVECGQTTLNSTIKVQHNNCQN